jgi:RND family efflux transporter MFP subunit
VTSPAPDSDTARLRIAREERSAVPRRRRRRFRYGAWVFLLLLAGGAALWFRPQIEGFLSERRAPEVRLGFSVRTRPGADLELTTASGYVVARTRAALAAEVAGRLVEINYDVGDKVEAGAIVARIDPGDWKHRHQEAIAVEAQEAAEVVAAGVRVEIARKEVDRLLKAREEADAALREAKLDLAEYERVLALEKRLAEAGSGRGDDLEKAENDARRVRAIAERRAAAIETLRAESASAEAAVLGEEARVAVANRAVEKARERVLALEVNLEDTVIRAPFAGIVLRKEAELGEVVVPALAGGGTSKGAVVTMADFSTLELEVDVFERDIRLVQQGSPAEILISALPDLRLAGRVRQIVPTADRTRGTVQVKVEFVERDPRILPEMGGKAVFLRERPAADRAPEVLAPASAVVAREGRTGVWIVENRRARWRAVEIGERRGDRVVVKTGLVGGEGVTLDPSPAIAEGTFVKIKEER